ncbi:MAG: heat-shock protein [Flavobacteriales bacterium]|nr:MAG: heat-shock protein [Flavobacteriales bacterium]
MKNLIIGLILITFASCNTQKKIPTLSSMEKSKIEDIRWLLIEFDGKPIPKSVDGKVHFLLSKKDKKLIGSNACNRLMGNYNISHKFQISFSNITSTRLACNNQDWSETEFNKTLETANNFSISENKLMLNLAGKRTPLAVFIKEKEEDIVNKYWKLKKLEGKKVEMVANQEREQYFIIRDNGTIEGFAGCNSFYGNYKLEKGKSRIKFNNLLSTLRACPDVEINESKFLKVFELTDHYTINGDNLMLNIGKKAPLAEFEAIYF